MGRDIARLQLPTTTFPLYTYLMKSLLLTLLLLPIFAFAQFAPLPVSKAYQFSAQVRDSQTIVLTWNIAPGYSLYKSRFHFSALNPEATRLAQPFMPIGTAKHDKELGHYQTYENLLNIAIPVISAKDHSFSLKVHYQGCADAGFCYPPEDRIVKVNLDGPYGVPVEVDTSAVAQPTTAANDSVAPTSQYAHILQRDNWGWIILAFIGFGLLLSFTPCVLPMIPILSSIIAGQKNPSHKRGFALSVSYVLGMAITYAIAGIIFAYLGANVQAILQNPVVITIFSLLFIAMALSLFGLYNIQLPEKWRASVAHASNEQKRGSIWGAFVMGILATLILSPCVTPPLVGALGFISESGDVILGGVALFALGIGIGLPLIVIGTLGGKYLPKAGTWMVWVKNFLGVLMLAVAVYLLTRILPANVGLFLWGVIAIVCAVGLKTFSSTRGLKHLLGKILGILFFIYAICLMIGSVQGNSSLLHPLRLTNQIIKTDALGFTPVKTVSDVQKQVALAQQQGKPVMLDFYADWCVSCKEMDHLVFNTPEVKTALKNYVLLRADVTANDQADKNLERKYGVVAPPTILFFKDDQEQKAKRIIGEMNKTAFLSHLNQP